MVRKRLSAATAIAVALTLAGCSSSGATSVENRGQKSASSTAPASIPSGKPIAVPATLHAKTFTKNVAPAVHGVPDRFTMWKDPWQAKWIGHASDGDQFFIGIDYDQGSATSHAYAVLFLWSNAGNFRSATIADLGNRNSPTVMDKAQQELLKALGGYTRGTLHVQPFAVHAYGLQMGFVPVAGNGYPPSVEFLPANDMAFTAPWSYGHYDT